MVKKSRQIFTLVFMLVFAVTTLFASFADPVWAEGDEKASTPKATAMSVENSTDEDTNGEETDEVQSVHYDNATFEKNFVLSVDQKKYTITEIEKVVDEIIDPEMSDLEKYYTLACWVNKHVEYDWEFWGGDYNFDYYSHQWDAYGGMKEDEKSVCVGIAIFYANMCHAADLPCRFVRLDPKYLDHTINYIPDINGNAYYVDVTENVFLMSDESGSSFVANIDKDFAHIEKGATDKSLDYTDEDGNVRASALKDSDGNYAKYDDWFNEYANHKNTDKHFNADYVEKGSGLRSTDPDYYHASYNALSHDDIKYYPSQHFLKTPDIWFLDDFYANPADIKEKIQGSVFDEQLLNVSGVKKNYDCDSEEALVEEVSSNISLEYFPSCNEARKVVAEAAPLTCNQDYEVKCAKFDPENRTAELEISGRAWYSGSITIPVTLNTAAVEQAPVHKTGLTYNGSPQELVEPGIAEVGEMQYALGTKTEPTQEFTAAVPTATDSGEYFVWYKAAGDAAHVDSEAQLVERSVKIAKAEIEINIDPETVKVGKTVKLAPILSKKIPLTYTFISSDKSIATVDSKGVVKGLKPGNILISVTAKPKDGNLNYKIDDVGVGVEVVKGDNPMTLKAKTVKVKYKALKKKAKVIAAKKAFTVSKQQGSLSYKLVSAKKGGKNFKKKFRINAKTGKVTVKKGLKKGTYKVTVGVKAKGNSRYKASAWKKVTFIVKVK